MNDSLFYFPLSFHFLPHTFISIFFSATSHSIYLFSLFPTTFSLPSFPPRLARFFHSHLFSPPFLTVILPFTSPRSLHSFSLLFLTASFPPLFTSIFFTAVFHSTHFHWRLSLHLSLHSFSLESFLTRFTLFFYCPLSFHF